MEDLLDTLLKVQELEDNIKKIAEEIAAIPHKIGKLQDEIQSAKDELTNRKSRIKELEKDYRLKEVDIADNENKINKLNQQTFAVKTNEEYRALLNEIAHLKKENNKTEDEMIALLEEEETLKKDIDRFAEETEKIVGEKKQAIEELDARHKALKDSYEQTQISFQENFNKLPDDVKKIYKKIKKVRGTAVCAVHNNTCTGCFTSLTPQFLNELKKRNKIQFCDNCGRILVFVDRKKK